MNKPLASISLAIALVAGGAWFLAKPSQTTDLLPGAAMAQEGEVDLSLVTEMVAGNPDAPVEVIEYASFTCPHCANFHANQMELLKENYIDPGLIRFVYREAYFDRPGLWASMVARCGGEMRFFGIVDMMFERQRDWIGDGEPAAIVANLRNIGKIAGLTDDELDVCLTDADHAAALVTWYEGNLDALNVDRFGTPSFVINGTYYSNMAYDEFAAILDEELAAAPAMAPSEDDAMDSETEAMDEEMPAEEPASEGAAEDEAEDSSDEG